MVKHLTRATEVHVTQNWLKQPFCFYSVEGLFGEELISLCKEGSPNIGMVVCMQRHRSTNMGQLNVRHIPVTNSSGHGFLPGESLNWSCILQRLFRPQKMLYLSRASLSSLYVGVFVLFFHVRNTWRHL